MNFKYRRRKKIIPGATIILMPSAESTVTPFSVPWIWKPDDKNPPFKRLHFKFVTVRSRSNLYFHKNCVENYFWCKTKTSFCTCTEMNDQRISDCKMGHKKSAEMNSLKNSALPKWQAHIITIWKETIFIVKFFPKSDMN